MRKSIHSSAEETSAKALLQRLGDVVKAKRVELGLSQRELAERALLKQSQISEIENGLASISLSALTSICRSLHERVATVVYQAEATAFAVPSILPFSRIGDAYDTRLGKSAFAKHCLAEFVAHLFRTKYRNESVGVDGGTTNQFLAEAIGRDVALGRKTEGMIVTNHEGMQKDLVSIRQFGKNEADGQLHERYGSNFKLAELSALLGVCDLQRSEQRIQQRIRIAKQYQDRLAGTRWKALKAHDAA